MSAVQFCPWAPLFGGFVENLCYDKRLLDHYLSTGKITEKDYKKFLDTQEDQLNKADFIDVDAFILESENESNKQ